MASRITTVDITALTDSELHALIRLTEVLLQDTTRLPWESAERDETVFYLHLFREELWLRPGARLAG